MTNFQTIAGGAIWMLVAATLAAVALEPVSVTGNAATIDYAAATSATRPAAA